MTAGARTPDLARRARRPRRSGARVTRCSGVEPFSTIATGVAGVGAVGQQLGRHLAEHRDAHEDDEGRGRLAHARARAAASRPSCPLTTWNAATVPRWVSGMPAASGAASALLTPGTTSTATPASPAREDLLAAAAVDERVAALEPDDGLPALRPLDEDRG